MEKKNLQEITEYLEEKEFDGIYDVTDGPVVHTVIISLKWGDWKHEHGYLDYLMEQIGYNLLSEVVTEEDGSDCYSSNHIYMFASKEVIEGMRRIFGKKA